MKVINLTRETQFPDVRHKDGKLDTVRIAPRSKADLRDGMTVDIRWLQLNPNVIRIVEDPKVPATFEIPKTVEPKVIEQAIAVVTPTAKMEA